MAVIVLHLACGCRGLLLWPLSFVAVIAVAVVVCGRRGFGRHSPPCGRHGLPSDLDLRPLDFKFAPLVAIVLRCMFLLNQTFSGFPISRKPEARDGQTDRRTGATFNAAPWAA